MAHLEIGSELPDTQVQVTGDLPVSLAALRGRPLVLYFYPKASTPGCTQEGLDFNAALDKFRRQSAVVLGASRDSLKAQENFRVKQGFRFNLVSDSDEQLCELFGVIKMKNMYGKQVRGIERSTFLIDTNGVLVREWRGVKVKGHVDEVLAAVKAL